jgi:PAS domain S-box-containing protein
MSDNEKVNILMVDDQPAKLLTYEAILSDLGANLIKVTSGREALEQLLRNDIAVVLMDVSMPEIDGFEMADMIRQHPRFQKTAIIFISGVHLSDSDRIRGYQRGAVDYISVPVVAEVLRAKVSVFSELHRKTRQLEKLNRELEQRVEERTQELRESEYQFRTLANSIPQLAWMANADGSIFWYNQRWFDYTGISAEELGGFGWRQIIHPQHVARVEAGLRRSWDEGELWEETFPLRAKNGSYSWYLTRAVPIFDTHGTIVRWFGTGTDISNQIAAEQEIRKLNTQLEQRVAELEKMEITLRERAELLELATEAVIVRDGNGEIQYWNSGAEALYGWKRDEVAGRNMHQILNTTFPVPWEEIESTLSKTGVWEGNLIQETRDHRKVTVASRKAFDHERGMVLEINRDITSRLQAEEALRQTEKLAAMGRVAGIIAHEINNPLEAITNAFYLLRDHPSLDEEAREYAMLADQELVRVSHITRQTLSFYRESKQPMELSVPELLDNVLELQKRRMQLARVELERDYKARTRLHGFPVELKQVFLNLVSNAIQAMPEGGKLRVSVRERARQNGSTPGISVAIVDTGSGILPQDSKYLFEPFFSTKSEKGTGLGLWISRGIIQKYEGTIRFRSIKTVSGNRTCFRVFIPFTKSEPGSLSLLSEDKVPDRTAARSTRG